MVGVWWIENQLKAASEFIDPKPGLIPGQPSGRQHSNNLSYTHYTYILCKNYVII